MMKHLLTLLFALMVSGFMIADAFAQQQITIRELNTYDQTPQSQDDLPNHPLVGVEVTFDAVIVSYPRNSGLASITSAGVPGRIHVFVADVNAIDEGLDGNSMQIVVDGAQRETLETLSRGDVVRVTGFLTFFNNIGQFNAEDVEFLGSIQDSEFEDLAPLLEPTPVSMEELNIPGAQPGTFRWNAENYTKYIFRYVVIEGAEVIDRLEAPNGRPWMIASQGNSVMVSNDTSLRFRNDRNNYAFDPETGEGLGYNYRRPEVDGPYVPPATGSVVNWSGHVLVNTFNPGGFDQAANQSTLKLAYFDDGFVWVADGDDPDNRFAPEGWPNDLVVLGFAPIIENFTLMPEGQVLPGDNISVSADVLLPEPDYTLESVVVEYTAVDFSEDPGDPIVEPMQVSGTTYSFDFGDHPEFTSLEFTIRATATTPDGVEVTASESASVFVESTSQTSPPMFSVPGGFYESAVQLALTSATEGAAIYYTTDGSDPDENSNLYTDPLTFDETVTVRAIAIASSLDNSPINSRTYEIEVEATEVSTIADLRAGLRDGTLYRYTGEAVVTFTRTVRNQKYIQDETGGILIDDNPGIINEFYAIGDLMSGPVGSLSTFQGLLQYAPAVSPGDPVGEAEVVPVALTLDEIDLDVHESMLIRVEDVEFLDSGEFESGENYDITDPSLADGESVIFRTNFATADYIGLPIPDGPITLTALVGNFNGTLQLIARFSEDLGMPTSTTDRETPEKFALFQNYPNPFNPTTNIRYSLAEASDVTLTVYDVLGRRVATLVNEPQSAGLHTVTFDATRLASGTYIYRLTTGDYVSVKKMLLIK